MRESDLIFKAYQQINEQSRILRSPAFTQDYQGDGNFPNAPVGNALPYGYVYGNTPEQSDAFIRNVLRKLRAGPNATLKRIEPVERNNKQYNFYYDGTPESFTQRVDQAIRSQLDQENRQASNANISYGVRVFLNKVLKKDYVPGEGGQAVTYIQNDNLPEPAQVTVVANPPEQLQAPATTTEPEATTKPAAQAAQAPETAPTIQFKQSDIYQLQKRDTVRVPPDLQDEYEALIREIGREMDTSGTAIISALRKVLGSYTYSLRAASKMLDLGILVKQEDEPTEVKGDFDPFPDVPDSEDDDAKTIEDIVRHGQSGRTAPQVVDD